VGPGLDGTTGTNDGQPPPLGGFDASTDGAAVGNVQSLYFDPPSATIVVDGTGAATASYVLKAVGPNGNVVTVTAESIAFDRPDLASVTDSEPVVATAGTSTSLYGGTGTIHALYGGIEATASLTVQMRIVDYGVGLGPSSPAVVALGGGGVGSDAAAPALPADPAANSQSLLYPYDKTVWPLGLTSPLIMWTAPQAADVYCLHYQERNYSFDGYYTLASLPAQMRLDQDAWDRITASNDSSTSPDPLTFSLSRWDHGSGQAYASASQTWTVAPESLRGAIYYWTASQTDSQAARNGHISRFRPGSGAAPEPLNNGACMGCHAVNAQGTILVADIDDNLEGNRPPDGGVPSVAPYDNWSGTRPWASFDITQSAAPLAYQSNKFGADVALTPDGKYLVFGGPTSVSGSKILSLGDPLTGSVLATSGLDDVVLHPGETNLEMPAFSPDGTKLAVIESANGHDPDNVIPGQPEVISYLDFEEASDAGTPRFDPSLHTVVDVSALNDAGAGIPVGLGYPSFTPDSTAVAFHAGTWSTGCATGCLDPDVDDGDLYLSRLDGGAPIRLAAANDPPDPSDRFASVEPTFNPVVRGGYSWVVFTSMRNWGNHAWPADGTLPPDAGPDTHVNGKRRLWVAAVDTTLGTVDPSHPAIYLEGQEDTPNMRGFWTLASCIATPGAASDDAGASSDAGAGAGSQTADAGACVNGFECCSGFCEQGVCVDVKKVSCVGVGGSCTSSSDCCNSGTVQCLQGVCKVPPPR
jgi:hypothetical protein